MRFCTLILSIYILILSAVPCCLYAGCDDNCAGVENTGHKRETKQDGHECCGACCPFSCHSCAGFIVPDIAVYPVAASVAAGVAYQSYIVPPPSGYSAAYWQPPDAA